MYSLYRTFQLVEIFRERNLFWYRAEAAEWLTTCDKVIVLANNLRASLSEARADEEETERRRAARAGTVEDLLADQIVLGAALQAGLRTTIPGSMVPEDWPEYSPPPPPGQRVVGGGISVQNEERVEEWGQYREELIKHETPAAIQDMSLMQVLLWGIKRRRLKIEHNVSVLEGMIFGRLLVSSQKIREYLHDLVFKGAWDDTRQALLNRIVKVFTHDAGWSSHSTALAQEFAAIRREFQWVGTAQGRQLSRAIEYAIVHAGGVAA